jgi:plasmid stability protein
MAVLTVRNVPDEVHRALRIRAAQHGRSTEAEVRAILESAVKPEGRVQLGTLMHEIARKAGITDADVTALEKNIEEQRKGARPTPVSFD